MHGATDRDLQLWWQQFNESYANLDRIMNETSICTQRDWMKQKNLELKFLLDEVLNIHISNKDCLKLTFAAWHRLENRLPIKNYCAIYSR